MIVGEKREDMNVICAYISNDVFLCLISLLVSLSLPLQVEIQTSPKGFHFSLYIALLLYQAEMRTRTACTVPVLLLFSPSAHAWGTLGHATIAAIANNYLTSGAQTYVSNILGAGVTMASVASWADDYRYTTAGKFSAPYQ